MTVNSSNINVTDLDFEDISQNIKSFLKGQDTFKDYDFDGSTLSILIDMMAYASHISSVNTNVVASELFLDSAQIRKNVVSRAKDLGFIPQSETASAATVDLTLKNVKNSDNTYPTTAQMIIPIGSLFETVYDGASYTFVVTDTVKPSRNGDDYLYKSVKISQGTWIQDQFIFDSQIKNPKYVLSNERVDRQRLKISVSSNGVSTTFTNATDNSTITTASPVYYLQENEDGFVEVYFGDGFLGKELLDGDIITVNYLVVDKIHANGARIFNLVSSVNGFVNNEIYTSEIAAGGGEKESIESIKFKATKFYTSQNRLVTLNDYKSKIQEYYPNADAVAVWGGEDNDPPEYGKVFVAIKPKNADYLTELEKSEIRINLNRLNMLTVRPEIISPDLVKILVSTTFKYNDKNTILSAGEIETLVESQILEFDNLFLNNFDSIFRHSKLVAFIDETDNSILSNITNIRLQKQLTPDFTRTKGYTVNFGNGLYHPEEGYNESSGGILTTDGFRISQDPNNIQFFDEDGRGNLRRYILSGSTRIYQDIAAGSVNYTTGNIEINTLKISDVESGIKKISFTVIPASYDVVAVRGNLIDVAAEDIKVTAVVDTISSGESSAGVGFSTTPVTDY